MIELIIMMVGVWCFTYSLIYIIQSKKPAKKPPPGLYHKMFGYPAYQRPPPPSLHDLEKEYRQAHPVDMASYRFVDHDEIKNYWNEQK